MKQELTTTKERLAENNLSANKDFEKIKSKPITVLQTNKIPYKSVLSHIKNIVEKNNAFDKLSKCSQIKEIALDALNLLMYNENVRAADGYYWSPNLVERLRESKTPGKFQKNLNKTIPQCEVCQRGLWMLSQARVCGIDFDLSDDIDSSTLLSASSTRTPELVKGLLYEDLLNMEAEYEGYAGNLQPYESDTKEKLANVICNVMVNCGFNRFDYTDYLKKWRIKLI